MARVDADERRVDHVCRLARAQWARGKAFFIQAPDRVARTLPWERLRATCLKSSAAQRLWRKSRTLTNARDFVKYKHSSCPTSTSAEAWWQFFIVEELAEFYPAEDPDALDLDRILDQTTWRWRRGARGEQQRAIRPGAKRQGAGGNPETSPEFGAPQRSLFGKDFANRMSARASLELGQALGQALLSLSCLQLRSSSEGQLPYRRVTLRTWWWR